jgi:carbonic anhydrase
VLASLAQGQRPFATILGCSDSRVPPELIFDAGFGSLFIIRVAGNVMAPALRAAFSTRALI